MPTLAPASAFTLGHLSDDALLTSTRALVGRSNQVLAGLLAHLGEVEARGIYRLRACSSLYSYCIYELRMAEDAACRRAQAAKLIRRFPALLEQVAAGELHLTGLLLLGPHLTEANHVEVLARAKHRTKKEIAALVRWLDPLPSVPARVEPLGPAARGNPLANPSWQDFVTSFATVRELTSGERPKDWGANADESLGVAAGASVEERDVGATPESLLAAQRYKVQFTATEEYVKLLEEAQALLAPAVGPRALEEVHLCAMRLLVAELKKRKYALTDRPRSATPDDEDPRQRGSSEQDPRQSGSSEQDPRQRGSSEQNLRQRSSSEQDRHPRGADPETPRQRGSSDQDPRQRAEPATPHQRGRYVPASARRAVWKRDGGRCAHVDPRGVRCRETRGLELHHEIPHARGGPPTSANLGLRCKAHNDLAAEQDFGRDFMATKKPADPALAP